MDKSVNEGWSKFAYLICLVILFLTFLPQVSAFDPKPWTVPGFILGPANLESNVNITIYDNATGNFIEDVLKISNETTGSYVHTFTVDADLYGSIYIDVYSYHGDVSGRNRSYSNMDVGAGTPAGFNVNVTMSSDIILTAIENDTYLNYNYTNFTWEYANFSGDFRFQIDSDESFLDPLSLNISEIAGNTTGNYSNFSMTEEQSLADGTYFWRVYSYDDLLPAIFDFSEIFTFVIDTVAPLITNYNPTNNTWTNEVAPELVLTTNENANCFGDNSSVSFATKNDAFGGDGTTSHNYTLDLLNMVGEGENTYYVQCNDTAGNIGIEEVYTINLDTVAPNTTDNFTNDNVWASSSQTITLQEDDPTPSSGINWTNYCLVAACSPSSGTTYTGDVVISTEGSSVFRYASQDNASNLQTTQELTIKIDTEAPNTTDNFSSDNSWINFDAEITLFPEDPNASIGDGSGINWTRYCYSSVDYSCTPETEYTNTITISDENITYFRYYSVDNVSNTQTTQQVIAKVDKTDPVTTSNFTQNGTWVSSATDVYLMVNDSVIGRNVSGVDWTRYCLTDSCSPSSGAGYGAGPITISTEGSSVFRFASRDNAQNVETTSELTIQIDTEAPNTTDNFTYDDTWINFDAEITLFPEDPNASIGDGSGINWTRYCYSSVDYSCTPDTEYTVPVTISDENITYFRYYSEDNVSNAQSVQTLIVKIDKTAPDESAASVSIDSGAIYSTDRILDFTWTGFTDLITGRNVSGISGYYYNFTNNELTNDGSLDTASPGQLTATTDGNWTIYVWAQDNVSSTGENIGNSVNASIYVDTIAPSYTFINQTNITEDSSGNFTFTINITESGSGHAFTPLFRYRYNQTGSYSAWENLTLNGGDEYQLIIEEPSGGWNLNRFDNISFQINATDLAGNQNISEEFLELVDSINDAPILDLISNQTIAQGSFLTFNVTGSDADNDTLEAVTLTFSVNETNLTTLQINNTLFEINWTPGNDYVGENLVLFTLSDGELSDTQEVLINVTDVNDAPVLDLIPNMTAYENVSFSQDINATDADLDTLTYGENSSLFVINPADGTFTFTPTNNDVGNHTILFNVSDGNGGVDIQEINLEILDVYSELNFTVQDRIFSTLLDNATLTGGDSCSGGCEFNQSKFVYQNNGDIEFNLTAAGYSTNSTNYSITENENFTILLEDTQAPTIGDAIIDYFINDSNGFYLNISVNASDNLALENVSFDYEIDAHNNSIIDTSGIVNMTLLSGIEHNVILGPYAYSFDLRSNQTALDYYSNSNDSLNDLRVYVYVTNGSGSSVNTAPVLAAIGNLTATVEKPFTHTVVAADAEGDALTYGENTTLFVIDESGGNFTFTPNSSQTGNYTILFNVTDTALTDTETINLEIVTSTCGDLFCSSTETCSSCTADCGTCPASSSSSSSSGGGGGGGGGGGSRTVTVTEYVNQTVEVPVEVEKITIVNETCVNNFTCGNWTPEICPNNGEQERSCFDANFCSDLVYVEYQNCTYLEENNVSADEPLLDYGLLSFLGSSKSLKNLVGFAAGGNGSISKIMGFLAMFLVLGLLLTPLVWRVRYKSKWYEISDLHAIIDGHEIHIRSIVRSNSRGSSAVIVEEWNAHDSEFEHSDAIENKIAKV